MGTFTEGELAKRFNLARHSTPMRQQAYAVRWSIEGGHERQRVRRDILAAAAKDASLRLPADALAAYDETVQDRRSESAIPKPRRYELTPLR